MNIKNEPYTYFNCLGQGAVTVSGKVETGYVQNGDRLVVMPAGEAGIVKGKF